MEKSKEKSKEKCRMSDYKVEPKIILEGRIYPAVKSCVRNRYLMLVGYISMYIYIQTQLPDLLTNDLSKKAIFAFWMIIVVHNLLNYIFNAKEQYYVEKGIKFDWINWIRHTKMELIFSGIFLTLLIYTLWFF